MRADDYRGRHYALLVDSIEASIAHLTETAEIEFLLPARIPFVIEGHGRSHEREVRACYAADRSIELVEAHDEGPFSSELGFGLHHYGGVVADLERAIAQQMSLGNEVDWRLSYDGQLVAVFFRGCRALPGNLEFVTAQAPPLLEIFAEAG